MSHSTPDTLAERYQAIRERIAFASRQAQRSEDSVTLIVVTKFHPVELALDLVKLGHRDFGENKDQEARPKFAELKRLLQDDPTLTGYGKPRVHFVGQLQSNKAKSVLQYAHSIHSLDRASLLSALRKERANLEGQPPTEVFIELNLTQDLSRGGIAPQDLLPFAEQVLEVDGLKLMGVMGVASLEGQEDRDFETIRLASESLQTAAADAKFISAGMSNDFEIALRHGATHLRIGTAITGPRQYLA